MITVEREPGVTRCVGFSRRETRDLAQAMLAGMDIGDADVHILLAGDREIERLNRQHLGLHGPTNVLSFPSHGEDDATGTRGHEQDDVAVQPCKTTTPECEPAAPDAAENCLGSIVISMDAVAREGFLYGEGAQRTLARLLCHGLLHLAGFEHGAAMDALTESLLDDLAPLDD